MRNINFVFQFVAISKKALQLRFFSFFIGIQIENILDTTESKNPLPGKEGLYTTVKFSYDECENILFDVRFYQVHVKIQIQVPDGAEDQVEDDDDDVASVGGVSESSFHSATAKEQDQPG